MNIFKYVLYDMACPVLKFNVNLPSCRSLPSFDIAAQSSVYTCKCHSLFFATRSLHEAVTTTCATLRLPVGCSTSKAGKASRYTRSKRRSRQQLHPFRNKPATSTRVGCGSPPGRHNVSGAHAFLGFLQREAYGNG